MYDHETVQKMQDIDEHNFLTVKNGNSAFALGAIAVSTGFLVYKLFFSKSEE